MKHLKLSLSIIVLAYLCITCTNREITCVLKGTISGRDSDTLYLIKATEDFRFAQIVIPISDSTFKYTLQVEQPEAYSLVFKDELDKGSWRPIYFFPQNGEINFKLFSTKDFDKNQIIGGKLNSDYENFKNLFNETFKPRFMILGDSSRALIKRNEYYSEEMSKLIDKLGSARDNETRVEIRKEIENLRNAGNDLTPKAKQISIQSEHLQKESNNWRFTYFEENPSIMTYYLLFMDAIDVNFKQLDPNQVRKCYAVHAAKFPNHPYTSQLKDILEGVDKIKLGGKYIDFKLPDINGKEFLLSGIIKDKIALIDLWATWCGPCILKSRTMIPIYEEFKDKGFTICGVAAEIENTNTLKTALGREKFPWINLVDLDQKNHIWSIYGRANSGGGMFLVDKDGTILAIDPTAEKVKNILTEKL